MIHFFGPDIICGHISTNRLQDGHRPLGQILEVDSHGTSFAKGLGVARRALFGQAVETGGMVGHEVECLFGISDCEVLRPTVVSLGFCVPRHFW